MLRAYDVNQHVTQREQKPRVRLAGNSRRQKVGCGVRRERDEGLHRLQAAEGEFLLLDGALAIIVSFFDCVLVKIIADYTGCLHFRHPYELGGLAFTMSIVWAQAFPFIALQFYEESDTISKDAITLGLVGSFSVWLLLNIAFFCT